MLTGKTYTLDEVARILLRRWWLILLPLMLGTAAGVLAYRWLPVQYQIRDADHGHPSAGSGQLREIDCQQRTSRIAFGLLASRFRVGRGWSESSRISTSTRSVAVPGRWKTSCSGCAGDIDVKLEGKESSFRVSYVSPDPKTAQKVTERLAALYIEENLRDRENLADSTSKFLESQLQDAKRRLIEQEKKLEEYRRRYAGQLPSQLQGNLQALQSAQMQCSRSANR